MSDDRPASVVKNWDNYKYPPTENVWQKERRLVLEEFEALLRKATGDGSVKRQRGEKPPWWKDDSHEGAIFSHMTKWKKGERIDPDSKAHPLVHVAWRALAIAYQETYGQVDPAYLVPAAIRPRDLGDDVLP